MKTHQTRSCVNSLVFKSFGLLNLLLWAAQAAAQTQGTATAVSNSSNAWSLKLGARYRMEESSYSDLANRKQFSHLRIRPMFTYDVSSGTQVVLEGQYAKVMGQSYYQPTGATANTSTETSGNAAYAGARDTIWMRQAYVDLKLSDEWNLLLGRQALSYGDQIVLGFSDWGLYGRAFDAARVRWTHGKSQIEAFQAVLNEATETSSVDRGDKDLNGLYITQGFENAIKQIEVYYFYLNDDRKSATGANNQNFGDYGTRLVTAFGDWGFKLEYAQNFGTEDTSYIAANENEKNNMVSTELSVKTGSHRWALESFWAGENWRELFPTTHSALGRTDVLGRRNLMGAGVHFNGVWSDLWATDLSIYSFQRVDKSKAAYSINSTTTRGAATETSRDLGTEVDFVAKYKLNANTTLSGSVSAFQFGSYFRNTMNSTEEKKVPLYSFFMVESKF